MNLSSRIVALRLQRPFVSHRGVTTDVPTLFFELEWNERRGVGAALLGAVDSGVLARLQAPIATCRLLLAGRDPFGAEAILAEAREALRDGGWPEARAVGCALDLAIHDLFGQAVGLPLRDLLGLRGHPLPCTALTLGEGSTAALVERAVAHRRWPILKIKISPEIGLRDVARVREVYAGELWVDGNQFWSRDDAVAAAETCGRLGVTVLEQPVKAGRLDDLRFVHDRSPVPIVADEDCRDGADVVRLAGCVSAVNIKVHKFGGLRPALDAVRIARTLGLGVMLGCRTESTVAVTATAQLAGLADHLDLDGHEDIADDPFRGMTITDGHVEMPERPGIGVTAVVRHAGQGRT